MTQTVGFTEQAGARDQPLASDPTDARLDVFPGEQSSALTTTDQVGVQRVVATAYGNTNTYWPEDRPDGALDGDTATAWRTQGFGDARGQRIEIDLKGSITTDHVNLVQPLGGTPNRFITNAQLIFDGGKPVDITLGPSSRSAAGQTIDFGRRTFRTFAVRITQTNDHRTNLFGQDDPVGFAEIRLRDVHASHDVRVDEVVKMPDDLLGALGSASSGHPLVLVMNRDQIRPVPPRTQPEQSISRSFTLPAARTFELTGNATVSPDAPGAAIEAALLPGDAHPGLVLSASGFLAGCLSCRADAAFDKDPSTVWQTPFDAAQGAWAQVESSAPLTVDGLDLAIVADGRHSVPTRLRVDVDGKSREVALPSITDQAPENATTTVHVAFPALRGRTVRVTIDGIRPESTKLYGTARTRVEPVGIASLGVPGVAVPTVGTGAIDSGCRSDLVRIDGHPVPVRVTGTGRAATTTSGLVVTPCGAAIELGRGTHVLQTAAGKDVGLSVDRLALASGTTATPVDVTGGRVRVGSPAPRAAKVTVVHNGDTRLRVHVSDATKPFWLVLGESQSPGWHAHVVGGAGGDLGASQLVDGYANGWVVTPPRSGSFDVVFEWTPQRQVRLAIWLSLLGVVLCLGVIVFTWLRRRTVLTSALTVRPGDAEVGLSWSGSFSGAMPGPESGSRTRRRWVGPVVTGLLGGLVVAPWVGVLTALVVFALVARPRVRPLVMIVPAVLLGLSGAYIVVEQYRYRYPPVFEWPTLFPRARTWAWIAVMLLAADAVVEILRSRRVRGPDEEGEPAPEPDTSVIVRAPSTRTRGRGRWAVDAHRRVLFAARGRQGRPGGPQRGREDFAAAGVGGRESRCPRRRPAARPRRIPASGPAYSRRGARRDRAVTRVVRSGSGHRDAPAGGAAGQGRGRPVAPQREGIRQRTGRVRRVGRVRGRIRGPPHRGRSRAPTGSPRPPDQPRCPAVNDAGPSWRGSSSPAAISCCSTSRRTTSTSTPRRG